MAHSAAAVVSIDEYLRTSYHPDVEYIDGQLKEKPVVGLPHGEVQAILSAWFRAHRKEWGIRVAVETRTRVMAERVRLPNIVVVADRERSTGAIDTPPLIAIEVSPTDAYADLKARAADLTKMGTENVWLIDPQTRTAEVWNGNAWQQHAGRTLQAVHSPMHIDLDWLWAELNG